MYEAHFGLTERPFLETVDPAHWVGLPSREAVLRRVQYAIDQSVGAALIHGPSGSGKSMVAHRFASKRIGPVIEITYPALDQDQLVAVLAEELGCGSANGSADRARRLRDCVGEHARAGTRVLVMIDDAQLVQQPEQLDLLRLLLNFRSMGPPDLDLLLCGTTELLLTLPSALADRLATCCLVGAMTQSETSEYIAARLASAQAKRPLFSDDAIRVLCMESEGLPRRLNRIADLSLLLAATYEREHVDSELVTIAAHELALPMA